MRVTAGSMIPDQGIESPLGDDKTLGATLRSRVGPLAETLLKPCCPCPLQCCKPLQQPCGDFAAPLPQHYRPDPGPVAACLPCGDVTDCYPDAVTCRIYRPAPGANLAIRRLFNQNTDTFRHFVDAARKSSPPKEKAGLTPPGLFSPFSKALPNKSRLFIGDSCPGHLQKLVASLQLIQKKPGLLFAAPARTGMGAFDA